MLGYDQKAFVRGVARRSGLAWRAHKNHSARLMDKYEIDVVLDVGANNGQYGRELISMGWKRRLISFEPLSSAWQKLNANARPHPNWFAEQMALGSADGMATINISQNTQSSSFRDILPAHVSAAPTSAYVGTEEVKVARLDSVIDDFCLPDDRCFLKLDVQGFEMDVLEGAEDSLARCVGLQAEMAVTPLYKGETLFTDMVDHLDSLGYCLMSIDGVFEDEQTGQYAQLEGIFYRRDEVERFRE
ncbi:MAG: FkbM family methyltransferase [Rubripirellula sp.]